MSIRRRDTFGLFVAAALIPSLGRAQGFPAKTIRIVVPYPPGGPTDAMARLVAADMQSSLGQSVIVENKAGASGAVGTKDVAKAEPDGHTLVLSTNQTHVTNAFLMKDPGYDPLKDFIAVAGLADLQHVLVVRKSLGVKSVADLIALARKEPGKLNAGSTGVGSGSHLTLELFKSKTGIDVKHIPFRGSAPLALEIVGERIDLSFATVPTVLGQVQSGDMLALAIASDTRSPQLPNVSLLKDQGVVGSEGDAWLALFAPAGVPAGALDRLQSAVAEAMAKPALRSAAEKLGIAVNVRDRAAFSAYWASDFKKWSDLVKAAGVKPE
jgi:tripartite-type tricarboxylate transporter receptor subunit TctC